MNKIIARLKKQATNEIDEAIETAIDAFYESTEYTNMNEAISELINDTLLDDVLTVHDLLATNFSQLKSDIREIAEESFKDYADAKAAEIDSDNQDKISKTIYDALVEDEIKGN